MATVFDTIIEQLEKAKKAATLENASFGFPNDLIEIKNVHFGDDRRGNIGDVIHPDTYIKNIARLHHSTWIINPINSAIELLRIHADTLRECEKIIEAIGKLDINNIIKISKASIEK